MSKFSMKSKVRGFYGILFFIFITVLSFTYIFHF